ncbi:sucrose phosphorylase [Arenicella chitinivorans]|uniref:Sucrose phosphorylase n=1 Tax=Arenicella chitinivorans TaxID=1329800 RepID=A0A918VMY8_9GAMM|nr:alpha-amylase family glycosyl hydrolase [Arenicella chitinivorans]GHA09333.1 sucrose phosphorylase [Arenicella chitinivorans]
MSFSVSRPLLPVVIDHLCRIYPDEDNNTLASRILEAMHLEQGAFTAELHQNKWSESDLWVITYGDSILHPDEAPLKTLKRFSDQYLKPEVSGLHILPFFPYSSDDGFAVINYAQVNESLGDWPDIEAIGADYDLMADLVINHCSQRSQWFENFKQRKDPGKDYFVEADPETDLSEVVRPRTSPLLCETQTLDGIRHVWCTFSHDQVDLDFANPELLIEMVRIIRRYLEQGVRIFRLDAVAFVWKEIGTNCVHLPQTHELVRLLRTLIEAHTEAAIVITETNVPNHENLSYFGNANEAHAIYNFSLPPLLLHALVTGTSAHLKRWQMSMPPAQTGTFYFNFIASHDGIGLRPANGLLSQEDLDELVNTMQSFGARISWRAVSGGTNEPYEINVALYDALQGTSKGPDKWQQQRFLCAHAVMLALEGVPGIYIHSLLATQNDYDKLELTGHNRSINRHRWDYDALTAKLLDQASHHSQCFTAMKNLLKIRSQQPAFHPNAFQAVLHLGDEIFAFWRQSLNRNQSIFCLHNMTDEIVEVPINSINLTSLDVWQDLISGDTYSFEDESLHIPPYGFVWLTNRG